MVSPRLFLGALYATYIVAGSSCGFALAAEKGMAAAPMHTLQGETMDHSMHGSPQEAPCKGDFCLPDVSLSADFHLSGLFAGFVAALPFTSIFVLSLSIITVALLRVRPPPLAYVTVSVVRRE